MIFFPQDPLGFTKNIYIVRLIKPLVLHTWGTIFGNVAIITYKSFSQSNSLYITLLLKSGILLAVCFDNIFGRRGSSVSVHIHLTLLHLYIPYLNYNFYFIFTFLTVWKDDLGRDTPYKSVSEGSPHLSNFFPPFKTGICQIFSFYLY